MVCLTCLYHCILSSSYSSVCVYSLVSLYPYILISSGSCTLVYIPAGSYPQVRMRLLVTSYPHILISLRSCTLCAVGILTSSHPHILRFMYSGWFWVYSHSHTLISKIFSVRNCLGNWNQIKTMVVTKKSGLYGNKSCIYQIFNKTIHL